MKREREGKIESEGERERERGERKEEGRGRGREILFQFYRIKFQSLVLVLSTRAYECLCLPEFCQNLPNHLYVCINKYVKKNT